MARGPSQHRFTCSFCGRSRDQVRRLIAGPGGVFVSDQCVQLCDEIIAAEPPDPEAPAMSTKSMPEMRSESRRAWWRRFLPGEHRVVHATI